jgi:hypothetical protein
MLLDANITVGGSIKFGTTTVYQTVVLVDVLWVLDSDDFLARYLYNGILFAYIATSGNPESARLQQRGPHLELILLSLGK